LNATNYTERAVRIKINTFGEFYQLHGNGEIFLSFFVEPEDHVQQNLLFEPVPSQLDLAYALYVFRSVLIRIRASGGLL
jgi:hypothetical protein